jgi:hypothetical protein
MTTEERKPRSTKEVYVVTWSVMWRKSCVCRGDVLREEDKVQHTPIRTGVEGIKGGNEGSDEKKRKGKKRKEKKNQEIIRPKPSRWRRKSVDCKGFVKMSAVMSLVGTHMVLKEPLLRCSRMKWWQTSMCFVLAEMLSVLAIVQVLWLSHNMGKGEGNGSFTRERNNRSQIASLKVLVKA